MNRREELLRLVCAVKLPANQGRTPDGDVVTFEWSRLVAIAVQRTTVLAKAVITWPRPEIEDESLRDKWAPLLTRLREWALSNVPEGIEIVEGVPRYRAKEREAFFDDGSGARWHFVRIALDEAGVSATAPLPPGFAGCKVFDDAERIRLMSERIAELEAKLSALTTRQPMETAPRDGTPIRMVLGQNDVEWASVVVIWCRGEFGPGWREDYSGREFTDGLGWYALPEEVRR